jgi:hypothetical protein
MNFEGKQNTKNQGTSQPEASQQFENGDMAKEWEELVELDDVQLATVVGGNGGIWNEGLFVGGRFARWGRLIKWISFENVGGEK